MNYIGNYLKKRKAVLVEVPQQYQNLDLVFCGNFKFL